MNRALYILGAPDPEMATIQDLLQSLQIPYTLATCNGSRVHPGNAYSVTDVLNPTLLTTATHAVMVECRVPLPDTVHKIICDHHNPGDPGYNQPPEAYWAASTLGQVWCHLDAQGYSLPIEKLPHYRVVAAADHCPAGAYAGKCPGVSPADLRRFRLESKAAFQQRSIAQLEADIRHATAILKQHAVNGLADLTHLPIIPELPEAALQLGCAYVANIHERDGRPKVVLGGCTNPEMVARWMDEQRALGRTVYGAPERGYAGAYLTPNLERSSTLSTSPVSAPTKTGNNPER